MSIGWFVNLADANAYFTTERLITEAWDELNVAQKNKVILNSYNRLYHDPKWDLPTYAEATVAEKIKLRIANAEMSYYLAVHLADEDRRKGIQAQGVIEAGIVKEKYFADMLKDLPVPPFVEELLEAWETFEGIGIVDLARDEEECANVKMSDCD